MNTFYKILVCGGRHFDDNSLFNTKMRLVWEMVEARSGEEILLIQGGCPTGAEAMARRWADSHGVAYVTVPARWEKEGKAAGPIRNDKMLTDWRPNLVLAFAGGRGTKDMVDRARKAGVEVQEVTEG